MSAVITIGLNLETAPSTTASARLLPLRMISVNCSTMMTPFCTEMPATAMKPTAADTDKCNPATASPANPPINVNGTISSTSSACSIEPNAQNSSTKIRNTEIGMMIFSRAIARC